MTEQCNSILHFKSFSEMHEHRKGRLLRFKNNIIHDTLNHAQFHNTLSWIKKLTHGALRKKVKK